MNKKVVLKLLIFIGLVGCFSVIFFSLWKMVYTKEADIKKEAVKKENVEETTIVDEYNDNLYDLFLNRNNTALFLYSGDTLQIKKKLDKENVEDSDIIQFVFSDIDKDGIEELHVKSKDAYYILKEQDNQLVIWAEMPLDYEPLRENFFLSYSKEDTDEEYRYSVLNPNGEIAWELSFSNRENRYYCEEVEVSKEQWTEMTEDFFGMTKLEWSEAEEGSTFEFQIEGAESVFEDENKKADREKAKQLYDRFINGEYVVEYNANSEPRYFDIAYFTDVTGEPDKHYFCRYAYFDADQDGIEELHIESARYYCVFSYENGELHYDDINNEIDRDFILLNNGSYLYIRDLDTYGCRYFTIYGRNQQVILSVNFNMECPVGTIFSQAEESDITYTFLGAEVSKEQYDALTERYYNIGSDKIPWVVLYDGN